MWVAGQAGALRIPLGEGEPEQLGDSEDARALAIDLGRAAVWLASRGRLAAFSTSGERRLAVALPAAESNRSLLMPLPADGFVWLVEGRWLSAL